MSSSLYKYVLSVDQSTQGTKCLLFDLQGALICRKDLPHRQIINQQGWVSHDPQEIYRNFISVVQDMLKSYRIKADEIACLGISNQRETSVVWNRETGIPVCDAIVWQCARAESICKEVVDQGHGELIFNHTGIPASPYFPAAKYTWILRNIPGAAELARDHKLCFGTIDTWLLYCLTKGNSYKTDYSNASRTQLFNIRELCWDREICGIFGICPEDLPKVCDSDALFGDTDFEGALEHPIPIHSMIGDSQSALFGQGCLNPGMTKATYGTGSSVVMNIGNQMQTSSHGLVTSLAWGRSGTIPYIMEGNINYSGAVITWLKDIGLISSSGETEDLAFRANPEDTSFLVPAFTGLGAPYWNSHAKAALVGMTRITGKPEIVKAALSCIAYQIHDILDSMRLDSGVDISVLYVDGGPTRNRFLMQFQSDIMNSDVSVPDTEELSGIGAAYMAGLACKVMDESVFSLAKRTIYHPSMPGNERSRKLEGWHLALRNELHEI